jgi:hypothetical protein
MSYEGYEEYLCAKGHLSTFDAYEGQQWYEDEYGSHETCFCGEKFVWTNSVDQTNGVWQDEDGVIWGEGTNFKVVYTDTCGECGKTKETRYAIPKGRGHLIPK